MGKKLRVQRRGRGGSNFRANKMGKKSPVRYPKQNGETFNGIIKELLHEPGRGAPLAYIELEHGGGYYTSAPEGIYTNQVVSLGPDASTRIGNVKPLGLIPEGTMICNVELRPEDGGRIARSSGSFATVVAHSKGKTTIRLPSKRNVEINDNCRATIGIVSGGGRREKPFMKAGEKHHAKRAKGRVYPITKGVKMASVSHPHGGGRHRRPGSSTTVSRHAPPGAKVGLIAARNSGKRLRRRKS
jgi:large subunit ribosomal protein L2